MAYLPPVSKDFFTEESDTDPKNRVFPRNKLPSTIIIHDLDSDNSHGYEVTVGSKFQLKWFLDEDVGGCTFRPALMDSSGALLNFYGTIWVKNLSNMPPRSLNDVIVEVICDYRNTEHPGERGFSESLDGAVLCLVDKTEVVDHALKTG